MTTAAAVTRTFVPVSRTPAGFNLTYSKMARKMTTETKKVKRSCEAKNRAMTTAGAKIKAAATLFRTGYPP